MSACDNVRCVKCGLIANVSTLYGVITACHTACYCINYQVELK